MTTFKIKINYHAVFTRTFWVFTIHITLRQAEKVIVIMEVLWDIFHIQNVFPSINLKTQWMVIVGNVFYISFKQ